MNRFVSNLTLRMNAEGRMILPEAVKTPADTKDALAFVGLGNKLQIWEPRPFGSGRAEATEKVPALEKELESQAATPN